LPEGVQQLLLFMSEIAFAREPSCFQAMTFLREGDSRKN
jgi:hypothetical protein